MAATIYEKWLQPYTLKKNLIRQPTQQLVMPAKAGIQSDARKGIAAGFPLSRE
ncbi:hypothetical protein [Chitinilyticum litopenaei]|uniref:hypothetical protein n=1 Tax=Chitinilyticum litopenaei TaxID=1121276 RepID=UPI0003FC2808|nr:hypothetical protein [Chitinilyticum litopenaei]